MTEISLERRSLAAQVADALRDLIISGEYPIGMPLRGTEVAMRLGVSRIPVREAFQQLEHEGLIAIVPYKGAVVSSLSAEHIEEYFNVRAVLESKLLRAAIGRISPENFSRARDLVGQMRLELQRSQWGTLNWRLHEELYRPADRPITVEMVKKIHDRLDRYVRIHLSLSSEIRERAQQEHLQLIELCERRRKADAVRLLTHHIQETCDDLLAFIEQSR